MEAHTHVGHWTISRVRGGWRASNLVSGEQTAVYGEPNMDEALEQKWFDLLKRACAMLGDDSIGRRWGKGKRKPKQPSEVLQ